MCRTSPINLPKLALLFLPHFKWLVNSTYLLDICEIRAPWYLITARHNHISDQGHSIKHVLRNPCGCGASCRVLDPPADIGVTLGRPHTLTTPHVLVGLFIDAL